MAARQPSQAVGGRSQSRSEPRDQYRKQNDRGGLCNHHRDRNSAQALSHDDSDFEVFARNQRATISAGQVAWFRESLQTRFRRRRFRRRWPCRRDGQACRGSDRKRELLRLRHR
jgi:hypothetical protein